MLYESMRLNNQRVPRKLMLRIAGKTLAEIAFEKMAVCRSADVTPVAGICDSDVDLIRLAESAGIEVHIRDVRSRDAESMEDGFWQLPSLYTNRFDWVVNVNIGCHPFLRVETLLRLIAAARTATTPLLSVREERGLLWGHDMNFLQGADDSPNSKTNKPYFVLTHVGGCYPLGTIADTAKINATLRPLPLELTREEQLDIDTPDDAEFLSIYAKGKACQSEN